MARLNITTGNNKNTSDTESDNEVLPSLSTILRGSKARKKPCQESPVKREKKCVGSHPVEQFQSLEFKPASSVIVKELRSSPRRNAKIGIDYRKFAPRLSDGSASRSEDDESDTDLSGFIVDDDVSEDDIEPEKSRSRRGKGGRVVRESIEEAEIRGGDWGMVSDTLESEGSYEISSPRRENDVSSRTTPESSPRSRVSSIELDGGKASSNLIDSLMALKMYIAPDVSCNIL